MFVKSMKADTATIKIHAVKTTTLESAIYWKRMDHRREQYNYYYGKAERFVDECVTLVHSTDVGGAIRKLRKAKLDVCKKLVIQENDMALTPPVCFPTSKPMVWDNTPMGNWGTYPCACHGTHTLAHMLRHWETDMSLSY